MERRTKMAMDTRRDPGRYNTRRSTHPYRIEDRHRKKKSKVREEDYDLILSFTIHRGEDIDPPSESISDRTYFLVWWLEPGIEFWAPIPETGNPFDPAWDRIWKRVRLDKHVWPGFIHVEIMRRRDRWGVGTSGGIATVVKNDGTEEAVEPGTRRGETVYGIESVSRCRIPLPRPGEKRSGKYGLVKSDGVGVIGQGYIYVTVELYEERY